MHGLIAAALEALGVCAQACDCVEGTPFTGTLCFQLVTAGDLLLGHAKVVGSAQRRQRGALLQHGAILLAASPYATVLPGILERSGRRLTVDEIVDRQPDRGISPADGLGACRHRLDGRGTPPYCRAGRGQIHSGGVEPQTLEESQP
jgi:hypothetical protein